MRAAIADGWPVRSGQGEKLATLKWIPQVTSRLHVSARQTRVQMYVPRAFWENHPSVFRKAAAKIAVTSISEHEQRLVELCQLTGAEALQRLGMEENGLSAAAVEQALRRYGPNVLSQSKKTGVVVEILQRCKNPLVIQLLVICAVSPLMGDVRSATVVGRMIVLSVVLAHVQEHRSSKAVERLHAMAETTCLVVRDGKECDVQMAEIVPGAMLLHSATRTATPDAACARRAAEY